MWEYIKNLFRGKKNMNGTTFRELEILIKEHLESQRLRDMETADRYYYFKHDILKRIRKAIGVNGELVPVNNLPNNKIMDNMYADMVDQKTNYLLSKNLSLSTKDNNYMNALNKVFDSNFLKLLHSLGKDAYKYGIAFLYVYYNEKRKLSFKKFNAKEIIPVWKDNEHTELDFVIRIYKVKEFVGTQYKEINKVEVYSLTGINYFEWDNGLKSTGKQETYMIVDDKNFNWERLPIIPFKCDESEIPLINKVKSIQDAINEVVSDFKNDMEQNARNTILVIKNYGGENGTLRHNMNIYGYIPVDENGGVEALTIEVNSTNYESILKILKKSLIENAKGFDAKSEKLQGNVNQMNIQSMYSDIDLDASAMEREFRQALNELLWFIKQDFINSNVGDFDSAEIEFIFNKDIMMNETQAIDMCKASVGIISDETIVAQHPWVKNVSEELTKIKKQKEEQLEEMMQGAFGTNNPNDVNE